MFKQCKKFVRTVLKNCFYHSKKMFVALKPIHTFQKNVCATFYKCLYNVETLFAQVLKKFHTIFRKMMSRNLKNVYLYERSNVILYTSRSLSALLAVGASG